MLKKLRSHKIDEQGFTLIELVVVVIVIAVLAAIAIPLFVGHIKHARTSEAAARLGAIMTASKTFFNKNNHWPVTPGAGDFFADFSPTKHFTYSIVRGGGAEAFSIRAEGRHVDGMGDITVTMVCLNPKAESIITISGI